MFGQLPIEILFYLIRFFDINSLINWKKTSKLFRNLANKHDTKRLAKRQYDWIRLDYFKRGILDKKFRLIMSNEGTNLRFVSLRSIDCIGKRMRHLNTKRLLITGFTSVPHFKNALKFFEPTRKQNLQFEELVLLGDRLTTSLTEPLRDFLTSSAPDLRDFTCGNFTDPDSLLTDDLLKTLTLSRFDIYYKYDPRKKRNLHSIRSFDFMSRDSATSMISNSDTTNEDIEKFVRSWDGTGLNNYHFWACPNFDLEKLAISMRFFLHEAPREDLIHLKKPGKTNDDLLTVYITKM